MLTYHFSKIPDLDFVPARQFPEPSMKPNGLWVSDESEYGWSQWTEDTGCMDVSRKHMIPVTLNMERILLLSTVEEIDGFTEEYGNKPDWHQVDRVVSFDIPFRLIRWDKVAEEYCGIMITPYQWDRRLSGAAKWWYYPWDCASGCIWHRKGILDIGRPEKSPERIDSGESAGL